MKCIRCGYESGNQFVNCPSCGAVQHAQPTAKAAAFGGKTSVGRSGGEIAAIVIAVIVSVLSVIAAVTIFFVFLMRVTTNALTNEEFGIDAFDDFDSNEYGDDIEKFFRDYYDKKNRNTSEDPAGLNTPLSFSDTIYSFSAGDVKNDYEVSMTATYRGEAALKLLEGAKLPIYNDAANDIYLVSFKVKITNQDIDAIVPVPTGSPSASPFKTDELFSDRYSYISGLPYANKVKLVSKGEETEVWAAFIVSKEDASPCIQWNSLENKAFRNPDEAISDASLVQSGAAVEITEETGDKAASDNDAGE